MAVTVGTRSISQPHTYRNRTKKKQELHLEPELAVALFPPRVYREAVEPCVAVLADGTRVRLNVEQVGERGWSPVLGTRAEEPFWAWLKTQHAHPGDRLIFHISGSKPPGTAIFFHSGPTRDIVRAQERKDIFAETIVAFLKPKQNGIRTEDIAARLLALGLYHDPVPPDALESILENDPRFRLDLQGWKIATRADRQYMALGLELKNAMDLFAKARPSKRKHARKRFCRPSLSLSRGFSLQQGIVAAHRNSRRPRFARV